MPHDNKHHHGVLVGLEPRTVLNAWCLFAGGAAALGSQHSEPVYDLGGWLGYCRREPGFGLPREPWTWALGRAHHALPRPGTLACLPVVRSW